MARILVAASPEPQTVVTRILAGHDLSCAETMAQAEEFLREQPFDLVFCTIVFDESKMFDLLRLVKSTPEWRGIPFVGARVKLNIVRSPESMRAVALTCRSLGAAAFLDLGDYTVDPENEMREAVEQVLARHLDDQR